MAQNRRIEKVSALLKRELSQILMNDLEDQRLHNSMITITEVQVSGDLQHCKIFVSIFGQEEYKEDVLIALEAAKGFLKGELGRRLKMRRTPDIIFKLDRGFEKGSSVLNLLGKLEEERQDKEISSIDLEE